MTPHVLLLTSRGGSSYLLTLHSVASIEKHQGGGCFIMLVSGDSVECTESLDSIVTVLGGLVLKPYIRTTVPR